VEKKNIIKARVEKKIYKRLILCMLKFKTYNNE